MMKIAKDVGSKKDANSISQKQFLYLLIFEQ